jgi:RHS repeat-associated protein
LPLLTLAVLACLEAPAQVGGFPAQEAISRQNRPRAESFVGASVDAGTGAFVLQQTPLSVQGSRTIDVTLSYNSVLVANAGALGPGWSHPFESSISGDPQGVVTVWWDANHKNSFQFAGTGNPYQPLDEAVRYDRLTRQSDGIWRLTRQDGTRYEFLADGKLNLFGNKVFQDLEMSYLDGRLSQVREPVANRRLAFRYVLGQPERLQSIEDEADRVLFFSYDSNGRLAAIRNPVTLGGDQGGVISPMTIPDNDSNGLTYSITVSDAERIGLVQLFNARILHPRPADLRVTLTSPQGTTVLYRTQSQEPDILLTNAILDNFEGENPQGTWRVRIVDAQAGSTGTLNAWRMRFTEPTDPTSLSYNPASQIVEARDPDGFRMFANQYDSQGRVAAQDDGVDTNEIATFSYQESADGVVTAYRNRIGETMSLAHDPGYHLTRRTDPMGAATIYAYNQNGDRTSITDALNRTTTFTYDANGNVDSVVDPAQGAWTMRYDGANNLREFQDPLGRTSRFTYDGLNNLIRVQDALLNEDTKTYNSASRMAGNLLEDGAGINYTYVDGMPVASSHPVPGVGSTQSEYDAIGRITRVAYPDGFGNEVTYNSNSRRIEEIDPAGGRTTMRFDRRDRLIEERDANGNVRRYEYDRNGNVSSIRDALGRVNRFEYDGEDRLVKTIDPAGNVTATAYDAAGRVIAVTDAPGASQRREYDAVGNLLAVYDTNDVLVARSTYDSRDQLISSEDAFGNVTTFEYDSVGRPVSVKDALDRVSTRAYDAVDRVTSVTDPLGRTLRQEYFPDDVVATTTDGRGNALEYRYDAANRLTRIETPLDNELRLTYDNRDRVVREQTPRGVERNFSYDPAGRLTRVSRTAPGSIIPDTVNEYDANGNLLTVSRRGFSDITPVPRLARQYDALDRMVRYTDGDGNTLRYAYDTAGNLETLTYPDGKTVRYTYEGANRLTSVRDWAGRITRYSHDANGRIIEVVFPNGTIRTIEYDAGGRIARRRDIAPPGRIIVDYQYSFDAAGQISVQQGFDAGQPFMATAASMSYDRDNRLSAFNGQPVTFDHDGNMTRGPLGASFADFTYDAENNLTGADGVSYFYDEQDRLIGFSSGGGRTRLVVDPLRSLSQILVKTDPGGSTSRYVYGVGLLYEEVNGGIRVLHYDQAGSAVAFSDDAGSIVGTVSYGPFGEIGTRQGATDSLFLYGALFGVATGPNGLNYMRFRWYSPQIKRFVNQDARFGDITGPATLNRFAYAGNNPISFNDPTGELFSVCAAIGAAIGAVVGVLVTVVTKAITGEQITAGDIVGAAVSGAIVGGFAGACIGADAVVCGIAGAVVVGGAAGAVGNLVGQGIDLASGVQQEFDGLSLGLDSLFGGVGGLIPGGKQAGQVVRESLKQAAKQSAKSVFKSLPFKKQIAVSLAKFELLQIAQDVLTGLYLGRIQNQAEEDLGGGGGDDMYANTAVRTNGRSEINRGRQGVFGEFAHWDFYLGALAAAGRPLPNNPNNMLATF